MVAVRLFNEIIFLLCSWPRVKIVVCITFPNERLKFPWLRVFVSTLLVKMLTTCLRFVKSEVVCLSILLEGRATVSNNFTKWRQNGFKISTRDKYASNSRLEKLNTFFFTIGDFPRILSLGACARAYLLYMFLLADSWVHKIPWSASVFVCKFIPYYYPMATRFIPQEIFPPELNLVHLAIHWPSLVCQDNWRCSFLFVCGSRPSLFPLTRRKGTWPISSHLDLMLGQ